MLNRRVQSIIFASVLIASVHLSAAPPPSSRALRVTVPAFVDGKHDLIVTLLYRDGRFHNAYATVPGRDNLVHRVDATPANPFWYVYTDGRKPTVDFTTKKMTGTYAYWLDEWKKLREDYKAGKFVIKHLQTIAPLAWDEDAQRLTGTMEIWIMPPDQANHWGLSAPKNFAVWRLAVDAIVKDGQPTGSAEAWTYVAKDMTLGMEAKRTKHALSAQWTESFWEAKPGSDYASGKDWPQVRGPNLTGAAIDCDRPLVDNLHDARLLWVAEEPITAGKGSRPKVDFGFYPANFSGWEYGAYAAPVIADSKVFLYVLYPDRDQARTDPEVQKHVLVKRGADPEIAAKKRHAVFCFDARTGRTLWRWTSPSFVHKGASGKSGIGLTPCYIDGKLFVRIDGITCFDAATGRILWRKDAQKDKTLRHLRPGGGWSHEESLVSVGGVLLVGSDSSHLVALDPATGDQLWQKEHVTGPNQLAAKIMVDGKPHIVVARGRKVNDKTDDPGQAMFLIEPRTGKVLWTVSNVGRNSVSLLTDGNLVCGNVSSPVPPKDGKKVKDPPANVGAFAVSATGAEKKRTRRITRRTAPRPSLTRDTFTSIRARGVSWRLTPRPAR